VVWEDILPKDWRQHAWRAPAETRIVDAAAQPVKALARLPITLHVRDKRMHFPFIVVIRLSVPVIGRCDFQREHTKAILPHNSQISWTTNAVSLILGYYLGARGRQYKKPGKTRTRPKEMTLAGLSVLRPGSQRPVKVVTRPTQR